jgi:hypothetical protein
VKVPPLLVCRNEQLFSWPHHICLALHVFCLCTALFLDVSCSALVPLMTVYGIGDTLAAITPIVFLRVNSGYLVHCSPDVFSDDEICSLNVNACKELTKVQKLQSQWCKPLKNHDKLPNNYVNLPRKAHMYRIQQPRTVM